MLVECLDVSGLAGKRARYMSAKVVISINTAWNILNFRSGLIRALVEQGYEVVAFAPDDEYAKQLKSLGCRFVDLPMDNKGVHPGRDFLLFLKFLILLRRERPSVFLGYTVKPNVYGSLAANLLGIPVINNITGLGAVFIRGGWLVRVVRWLYRNALKRSAKIYFQNLDDRRLFVEAGLVRHEVTDLLPGSGIDLVKFGLVDSKFTGPEFPSNLGRDENLSTDFSRSDQYKFRFLLIARMIRDKGVVEYVEAARKIKERWPSVEFCLLGFLDVENPAAISRREMDAWVANGAIEYLGVSDDVRSQISLADCVVLPSYREGTPRTLLEAAAMGLPIITSDAVGCREVVDDGVNGYLCKVRDSVDLAAQMEKMLSLSSKRRLEMGLSGRRKVEREFDEQLVINKYLASIATILAGS